MVWLSVVSLLSIFGRFGSHSCRVSVFQMLAQVAWLKSLKQRPWNVNALESQLPRTRRCPQVLPQWKFASREGHTIRSKPSTSEMRHSSPETRGIVHYYHWEVLELESKNMQERCELEKSRLRQLPLCSAA